MLDFKEIEAMTFIIELITSSDYRKKFRYQVEIYDCLMMHKLLKEPKKEIRFGNTTNEKLDIVYIKVYKDMVEMHSPAEGSGRITEKLRSNKQYPIEDILITILSKWSGESGV